MSEDTPRTPDFVEDTPVEETAPEPVVETTQPEPVVVPADEPLLEAAEPVFEPQVVAGKCPVCGHRFDAGRVGDEVLCPNCSQGVEVQPVLKS